MHAIFLGHFMRCTLSMFYLGCMFSSRHVIKHTMYVSTSQPLGLALGLRNPISPFDVISQIKFPLHSGNLHITQVLSDVSCKSVLTETIFSLQFVLSAMPNDCTLSRRSLHRLAKIRPDIFLLERSRIFRGIGGCFELI